MRLHVFIVRDSYCFEQCFNFWQVAIHCHAGLGRTGVLICCFLMWSKDFSESQAVEFVRSKR